MLLRCGFGGIMAVVEEGDSVSLRGGEAAAAAATIANAAMVLCR